MDRRDCATEKTHDFEQEPTIEKKRRDVAPETQPQRQGCDERVECEVHMNQSFTWNGDIASLESARGQNLSKSVITGAGRGDGLGQ